MNCPRCGTTIPTGQWQRTQLMENSAAMSLPGLPAPVNVQSVFRKTPVRKMEMVADVLVPLTQAAVSGILVGVLATPLFLSIDLPWYAGIYTGALSVGVIWGFRLGATKETLWIVEELIGQDIDQDGHAGAPSYGARVDVRTDKGWQFDDLPGQPANLHKFAIAVAGGESFSERTAFGCGLTEPEWKSIRNKFIDNNWAYWRNPEQPKVGVDMLRSGRAIIRSIADTTPPSA